MNASLDWSITQRLLGAIALEGEALVLSVTSRPDYHNNNVGVRMRFAVA